MKIFVDSYRAVTSLGDDFVSHLKEGKAAFQKSSTGESIGPLDRTSEERVQEFAEQYPGLDRIVHMAIAAADNLAASASEDIGVFFGSSRGATSALEKRHEEFLRTGKVPVDTSPITTLGGVASSVAHHLGGEGAGLSHSVTCSTSLYSVATGIAWMKSGMVERAVVGGVEASLTPFTLAQMKALNIYSPFSPEDSPCRPLWQSDARTSTFVLGEGAGAAVLTNKETGVEIVGVGVAIERLTSPTSISDDGQALQGAMQRALRSAGLAEVDVVVPHAPGTRKGDRSELLAIDKVFGARRPAILSPKWLIGHTFGASGILSFIYGIELLKGVVPASPRYPSAITPLQASPKTVMLNAAGFGGNACSVILKRNG